jgi:hypothetical protein
VQDDAFALVVAGLLDIRLLFEVPLSSVHPCV